MKIIALILTIVGMLISGISSLGMMYSFHTAMNATKMGDAAGLGVFASWIATAQTLNYVNIFGMAILFFGLILIIISMFTGKKP